MTKDVFINMEINKQIDYLNNKLKDGATVSKIRNDIGISEKALQKIIKCNGYKYNQQIKQYTKCDTEVILNTVERDLSDNTQSNTLVIPNDFKHDLLEILEAKNKIFRAIEFYENEYYKSNTQVIEVLSDEGIKIKDFEGSITQTSFKLHKEALDAWKSFCLEHKEFSKQDLLSMALIEYIQKYKKNT